MMNTVLEPISPMHLKPKFNRLSAFFSLAFLVFASSGYASSDTLYYTDGSKKAITGFTVATDQLHILHTDLSKEVLGAQQFICWYSKKDDRYFTFASYKLHEKARANPSAWSMAHAGTLISQAGRYRNMSYVCYGSGLVLSTIVAYEQSKTLNRNMAPYYISGIGALLGLTLNIVSNVNLTRAGQIILYNSSTSLLSTSGYGLSLRF